jgi:chromosome segregation ATPase
MESNFMEPEYATQQFEQITEDASQSDSPSAIYQLIEQIGTRYIADLQALSQQFGRFYDAQLAAKDQQLIELQQRLLTAEREHASQEEQIAKLQQRLEIVERERDTNVVHISELKRTSARYIAHLRALSDQLSKQVDLSEAAEQSLEVGRDSP